MRWHASCCGKEAEGWNCAGLIVVCFLFVLTFSLMIPAATILNVPYDFDNLPNFATTQCTPVQVSVVKMPGCSVVRGEYSDRYVDEWIAIWKCLETGASLIENPFASNSKQVIAQNSINDYPLNVLQNISCNTAVAPLQYPNWSNFYGCQVWSTCMLDVDMIQDLQQNAQVRYYRGYQLLYASLVFLVVSFVALAFWLYFSYRTPKQFTQV